MRCRVAGILLSLLVPPVSADVVLLGEQHIGSTVSTAFIPSEPVSRAQHRAVPTRFHLSAPALITGVRLDNPVSLQQPFSVVIDDQDHPGAMKKADTLQFATPLSLQPGIHTIAIDTGCMDAGGAPAPCGEATRDDDVGFSSITLLSPDISTSVHLVRRRHGGEDSSETDHFLGRYYPDVAEGHLLSYSFVLPATRRLSEIRIYGLREVAANPHEPGAVTLNRNVLGNLANGDPHIIPANVVLAGGERHALQLETGRSAPGQFDDLSLNEVVLLFAPEPFVPLARFNAVDQGTSATAGTIRTKIAGVAFILDLAALNEQRSGVDTKYKGRLQVDLLDARDDGGPLDSLSSCRSSWIAVHGLGVADFKDFKDGKAGVVSLTMQHDGGLARARIRMTDESTGEQACSRDAFAIRPAGFAVMASHRDPATPGTTEALSGPYAANSLPVHRAGRPYTLRATPLNAAGAAAAGYDGSPTVLAAEALLGERRGLARADQWSRQGDSVVTHNARYGNVGAIRLQLRDTSFAIIDTIDTPANERWVTTGTVDVGRFIPDSFRVEVTEAPEFQAACGGFTYVGQPFNYRRTPRLRIKAVSASGHTTTNYTGTLFKLPAHLPQSAYEAAVASLDLGAVPVPDNTVSDASLSDPRLAGQANLTLTLGSLGIAFARDQPLLPFNAEIALRLPLISDGEARQEGEPFRFGKPEPGGGIPFFNGAKRTMFGLLQVGNALGSEHLPLQLPVQALVYDGLPGEEGFVPNALDACTVLSVSDVVLDRDMNNDGVDDVPTKVTGVTGISSGVGRIDLSAPGVPGDVVVSLNLSTLRYPWLRTEGDDANLAYDEAPFGLASFGLFRGHDRRIHVREIVH